MSKAITYYRQNTLLFFVFIIFGLAVIYVNPFRDYTVSDDWSYMVMAKHLNKTGVYQIHEWSSSNLLFQVYWSQLFLLITGYSIATLHFSVLVLSVVGIVAFYYLALEFDFSRKLAGFLTLIFVVNPFYIYLTCSYMTDIPFLAMLVLSVLCYVRAVRRQSYFYMFLGSLFCLAGVYTRSIGLVLIPALLLIWLLGHERIKQVPFYLSGIFLPFVGAFGLPILGNPPTGLLANANNTLEVKYITNIGDFLIQAFVWRPGTFVEYMSFFSLPLVVICLFSRFASNKKAQLKGGIVIVVTVFLALGLLYFGLIHEKGSWSMPYLPWFLYILRSYPVLNLLITFLTLTGAVVYGTVFLQRYLVFRTWFALPLHERFLDVLTIGFFAFHVVFFNIGERYLLVLVPYTLLVIGRHFKDDIILGSRNLVSSSFVFMLLACFWSRDDFSQVGAYWTGSEYARTVYKADPYYVQGTWGWYSTYSFNDFLAKFPRSTSFVNDFYDTWLPEREANAQYLLVDPAEPPPTGQQFKFLTEIDYQDALFRTRRLWLVKREYVS